MVIICRTSSGGSILNHQDNSFNYTIITGSNDKKVIYELQFSHINLLTLLKEKYVYIFSYHQIIYVI
jgi:hypothetical protein